MQAGTHAHTHSLTHRKLAIRVMIGAAYFLFFSSKDLYMKDRVKKIHITDGVRLPRNHKQGNKHLPLTHF